jgi:hypothetical protein
MGVKHYCELKFEEFEMTEEEIKNHKFYKTVIKLITDNVKYTSRIREFTNSFKIYQSYTKENLYKNFEEYMKVFSIYLFCDEMKYIYDLTNFEKISFNTDSIPDESLIILQALTMKRSFVSLDLNRIICHICNKKLNLISKIILSNCHHCYCYDCLESFLKEVTENTMKLSVYIKNDSKATCKVDKCKAFVSVSDVKRTGKLIGGEELMSNKNNQNEEIGKFCMLCQEKHSIVLLSMTCCEQRVCRKSLKDRISSEIEIGANKRPSTIRNIICPLCAKNISWIILENLLGEEEYKKRFSIYIDEIN